MSRWMVLNSTINRCEFHISDKVWFNSTNLHNDLNTLVATKRWCCYDIRFGKNQFPEKKYCFHDFIILYTITRNEDDNTVCI